MGFLKTRNVCTPPGAREGRGNKKKNGPLSPAPCRMGLTADIQAQGPGCLFSQHSRPAHPGERLKCLRQKKPSFNPSGRFLGCSKSRASRPVFWRVNQFPSVLEQIQGPFMPRFTDCMSVLPAPAPSGLSFCTGVTELWSQWLSS